MSSLIKTPYKKGQRFTTTVGGGLDLKIMAKEDNYLMCKYMGCVPFVIFVKNMPAFLFKIGAHIKN